MAVAQVYNAAPVKWFGGKQALVSTLLPLLPAHETYVEVFGGAASLLFSKVASSMEVYNDVDGGIVNFFRVLRDREACAELMRLLDLTPYAREEYLTCMRNWQEATDPVERARRWFIMIQLSFGGMVGRTGWSYSRTSAGHAPRKFRNNTQALSHFSARLKEVQIENRSFEEIFDLYDDPRVLFYLDPPYHPDTRRDGVYAYEMTIEQHAHLLDLAVKCKGMVILSGYDHQMYNDALVGWRKETQKTVAQIAAHTRATRLKGKGVMRKLQERTECIWVKPNTILQPTLFGDLG